MIIFWNAGNHPVNVSQTDHGRTILSCENGNQDSSESESAEEPEQDVMLNSPPSFFIFFRSFKSCRVVK